MGMAALSDAHVARRQYRAVGCTPLVLHGPILALTAAGAAASAVDSAFSARTPRAGFSLSSCESRAADGVSCGASSELVAAACYAQIESA